MQKISIRTKGILLPVCAVLVVLAMGLAACMSFLASAWQLPFAVLSSGVVALTLLLIIIVRWICVQPLYAAAAAPGVRFSEWRFQRAAHALFACGYAGESDFS